MATPPPGENSIINVRDALTGAHARAMFAPSLANLLDRARLTGEPVSLLLIDLDYFKSVNDAYGHRRGDEVLRVVFQRLQAGTRRDDQIFRYGGEEFMVILPRTGKLEAISLAELLLRLVSASPIPGEQPLSLTISIGVATAPAEAATVDDLVELADQRQFIAKRKGRARVVSDSDDGEDAFGVEPSRLIERDDASAQLHRFLADAAGYHRAATLVVGQSGSGHTRFLRATARAANLRGYITLNLGDTLALQMPSGAETAFSRDSLAPSELVDTLRQAREGAADCPGWLITLDCNPLPSDAALNLLKALMQSPRLPHLLLVAATTPSYDTVPPLDLPLIETAELRPLSVNGIGVWLRATLHWEPPADFLGWFQRATHGLPSAIQQGLTILAGLGALHGSPTGAYTLRHDFAAVPLERLLSHRPVLPHHNLTTPLTDLIDREAEVRQVRRLVLEQRLVTLTGTAGIGKTRLAQQVGLSLLDRFPGGVYFVPLESVAEPERIAPALASILAIPETTPDSILVSLKERLAEREALLILDNLEQVIAGGAVLGDLLQAAPRLHILATSREPLRIYGEQRFEVPLLGLPEPGANVTPRSLLDYPATALFVSRARAARFDFQPKEAQAALIVEICRRLDGLPLAIELAAARISDYSLTQLLDHLNGSSRLALLSDGPRNLPGRQQALRAAIDWSYRLLDPELQRLLGSLGVFAGAFSSDAVRAICRSDELAATHSPPVLELLSRLVERSMLQREGWLAGEQRYRLLETLREYALSTLDDAARLHELRQRHAAYFRDLAERAEPELIGANQRLWLDRLDLDYDNLRAAIDWSLDVGELETAGRTVAALWRFWEQLGRLTAGRTITRQVLDRYDRAPSHVRCRLLAALGSFAWVQGDIDEALERLREALAVARVIADDALIGRSLNQLAIVERQQGDFSSARQHLEETIEVSRRGGNPRTIGLALGNLGRTAMLESDYDNAASYFRESMAISQAVSDFVSTGRSLRHLGAIALLQERFDSSASLLQEGLAIAEEIGDTRGIGHALMNLG
ncbi:MAG TPA: diguanylate cyclase, partial [Thermomicrobiaceae bacterium]|nr:diguanylate cyclase [Thermomicrobiaceae bacterium]